MRYVCARPSGRRCVHGGTVVLLLAGALYAGPRSADQCEITVPFARVPPKIDGNLDDPCWQNAARARNWSIYTGKALATEQTLAIVAYDAEALYVGLVAAESDMDHLVMTRPGPKGLHDSPRFFQADMVEVFLDPPHRHRTYFQFGGNARAARYDGSSVQGGAWDGDWRLAGSTQARAYVVEMAIPFTCLIHDTGASTTPRPGARWGANFCRMQYNKAEWSAWSHTGGGFGTPSRFGHIVFGPRPKGVPDVHVDWPDPWGFGHRLVWVRTGMSGGAGTQLDCELTVRHSGREVQRLSRHMDPGLPGSACPFGVVPRQGGRYDVRLRAVRREGGVVCCVGHARFDLPDVHGIFRRAAEVSRRLASQIDRNDVAPVSNFHARCARVRTQADDALQATDRARNEADWNRLARQSRSMARDVLALEQDGVRLRAYRHCRRKLHLPSPRFGVGVEGSLRKVFADEPFRGRIGTRVSLWSAANEAESCQIVVLPLREKLLRVRLRPEDLSGPGGATIPAARIQWHPVGTVDIVAPPFTVRRTGSHPDPFLPALPVDVPLDRVQPFWVTLHVPADARPGFYTGKVWVEADGAPAVPVELIAGVWGFALPPRPRLRLDFRFSARDVERWYGFSTLPVTEFARWAKFLAAYRLGAYWAPGIDTGPIGIEIDRSGRLRFDYRRLDAYLDVSMRHGLGALNANLSCHPLGITAVLTSARAAVHDRRTGKTERVRSWPVAKREALMQALLADYVSHLKSKGWFDVAYYQGMHEPSLADHKRLKRLYGLVHRAAPELPRLAAGCQPGQGLEGCVDIWCPLTPNLDAVACQRRRRRGERVWWYVCGSPRPPYANLLVPQPAIEHRMLFWQTWQHQVEGLLYGGVNRWANRHDKPGAPASPSADRWPRGPFPLPRYGDGVLAYPGPDGPLGSVRLEVVRDGIEDYDYFCLLRDLVAQAAQRPWQDQRAVILAEARKALTIGPEVSRTLTDYTRDPVTLERARRRLAQQIVALRGALDRP